jgi:hypothetical protein
LAVLPAAPPPAPSLLPVDPQPTSANAKSARTAAAVPDAFNMTLHLTRSPSRGDVTRWLIHALAIWPQVPERQNTPYVGAGSRRSSELEILNHVVRVRILKK